MCVERLGLKDVLRVLGSQSKEKRRRVALRWRGFCICLARWLKCFWRGKKGKKGRRLRERSSDVLAGVRGIMIWVLVL